MPQSLSPFSEESIRRLGESALIKRKQFASQGRTFGPVAAAAFAEGQLRAGAEARTENVFREKRFRLEEERLVEETRRFDAQQAVERRARRKREDEKKRKSIKDLAIGAARIVALGIAKSDCVLKKNIVPLVDTLEKVKQLRGVQFDWKDGKSNQIGVIAQEIEDVLPEAVKVGTDGFKEVDYQMLVGFLVDVVGKQQREIDSIKESIAVESVA